MATIAFSNPVILTRFPTLARVRGWVIAHPWEAALGAVMLASLGLRIVWLGTIPGNVTADEADNMQVAFRIVSGNGPNLFGLDWKPAPAFSTYVIATAMTLFGWTVTAMRLSSALLSTLALLPFYALARRVTSPLAALMGAVLLACNPWWLNFSRSGWENAWTALYLLSWLHFLLKGFETGKRSNFALAGVFAALCMYGYFAGWMILPISLVSIPVAWLVFRSKVTLPVVDADAEPAEDVPIETVAHPSHVWMDQARAILVPFAVMLGVALVVYTPQLRTVIAQLGQSTQRVQAVSTVGPGASDIQGFSLYVSQAVITLKAYFLNLADVPFNGRYNNVGNSIFDPLTAVLLWIGLVMSVWHWRGTLWWWVVILFGMVPIQVFTRGAPDGARAVPFAPFLVLFVALGIGTVLRLARLPLVRRLKAVDRYLPFVMGILVLLVGAWNVNQYFAWMQRPDFLGARQPAVELSDFNSWMSAQFADIRAGRGGFNVGQWQNDRAAMLTRAGLPPDPAPVAARAPAQQPAVPAPAAPAQPVAAAPAIAANTRVPMIPLAQGLGNPIATLGMTFAPTGDAAFKNPSGIAVDSSGNVYVADPDTSRVLKFDPAGKLLQTIGAKGDGEGQLQQPFDLALDPQGNLYVLDTQKSAILRFNAAGVYQATLLTGQGAYSPRGLTIGPNGHLYVADTGRSRVVEITADNALVGALPGPTDDQPFDQPTGVAADQAGDLFVAVPTQKRLVKLAPDGHLIAQRELEPSNTRDAPHLSFTPTGQLAVTESGSGRVSLLDPTSLSRVAVLADRSSGLDRPVGIAALANNQVYVVDAAKAAAYRFDGAQP